MLDARIAPAPNKIIQKSQFKKKVSLEEKKVQKEDRFLRGRQIAFMIYDYFRVTGAHDTVFDCADSFSVALHDDNIQEFETRWDEVLLSMSKIPSDDILASLYKLRICESDQLKSVFGIVRHGDSSENIDSQLSKIEDNGEDEYKSRNFDARHGRIETGAVVKNRKGMSGVEGGKGTSYQWKEKGQCSKGDQCSFRHESDDRAQKPEHNAATPPEPSFSRGRSVSKKRSIQGKSNHGAILRQPCRYYLKGTCTRSPCENWHPPECQFYKTETGCKVGDKCLFPHHKVDEQPNKKPKKGYYSHKKKRKRRQECSGYCENCTTIDLHLAKLGCVGFSKRQTVPGKPDAKSLGINSKCTVHSLYAASSKYLWKERTIAR